MKFDVIRRASPLAKAGWLLLLILFVLVCVVHPVAHHDTDTDGLGLIHGLAGIALVLLMLMGLALGHRRRFPDARSISQLDASVSTPNRWSGIRFRSLVPLRC